MASFNKYGNIMIDLETLSTHKNAAIIEVGAVEFNKETGEIGDTFNVIINPSDWCKNNRHVDGETVQWWFKQSTDAQNRFVKKQEDVEYLNLKDALESLKSFIIGCDNVDNRSYDKVVVWGNGSTMDISILEDAYEYFEMSVPWKYWAVNDVRTIVDLYPQIKKETSFTEGIKHSAVADCLHQIKYITETIKYLRNGKS